MRFQSLCFALLQNFSLWCPWLPKTNDHEVSSELFLHLFRILRKRKGHAKGVHLANVLRFSLMEISKW